jgi:large subunit ribosomal protein L15
MLTPVTMAKIQQFIKLGRIDGTQLITMRTLYDSGCVTKVEHGIKLLSGGLTQIDHPIHIQLTDCSEQARTLLESNNGSVHLVWFNRMTLRAHLNPVKFLKRYGRLPKATGVPPPKRAAKYGFVVEHVDN